ncbi:baseplate wedge subunit [Synechococcus phage ACG-2014i]|uniref:Baseplate wedge protein n=1 Tax=Synechococcus phage ACG-2014i TaxID=1493513 RepID=A0A0E3HGG5_9CAUD|nr:baseplate wedge subunit [Synechococcus phage ACG-2014i]AIX26802.1 baseplate wedge protein [Synechococcus phage ACG-2014i]
MAAIISDKFRIFNAKQFLESLTEGPSETSAERTRMYFFVGRPQPWKAYIEVYSKSSTNFTVGNEVYVGTYGSTAFRATVAEVYDSALLLTDVFGSNGTNSVPPIGSSLKETADGGSSDTAATAQSGVYRYATEDIPPLPLDNQREKLNVYDEIIAAKRITDAFARTVIRRYNWDQVANPKFDMWKPDYSSTPGGGGQVGKQTATNQTSISDAKFYVMNSDYEVFKCLYNGENVANASGQNATEEPKTSGGNYASGTGLYTETSGAGYIWKYMYTMPTDDVLRFLSSDFMPIVLPANNTRTAVTGAAVDGAIDVALIEDGGVNLPASQTLFTSIKGDGTGGVIEFATDGSGTITSASVQARGQDYTYANVLLGNGNLFSDAGLTTAVATAADATGAIEVVMPPEGGHGFDHELELNGKRVMTNIRLTYSEGSGDFPVDNDFRRIGIIKDPVRAGTSTFATQDTLSGLKSIKITGATADFIPDETISQTVTSGTAKGTVVSWVLDSGSSTAGVLKYIQTVDAHVDQGVVQAFESNGSNAISGVLSAAAGNVDTTYASTLLGVAFTAGLAGAEIKNNSGDVIYQENRRLITRAPDQIEDIKLVIEF